MNTHNGIRILFFGTSAFAVPALEALAANGYTIAGIITQPDEPAGRGQVLTPPPIKTAALGLRLHAIQPKDLGNADWKVHIPEADLYIVAAYGKIISSSLLEIPRLGALNIHPSLLPRWRGPSPIQYAILHGDAETGVTIMSMDAAMDHGPIVAAVTCPLSGTAETYAHLHDTLAVMGAALLIKTLPAWIAGEAIPLPQNHLSATYTKILTRDDGRINWKKSAQEIERMVRAFQPWPGAWTLWTRDGAQLRLRIEAAEWTPDMPPLRKPGLVWQDGAGELRVAAAQGSLVIKKIGAEGKDVTDAASFVRGYPAIIGAVLS